MEFGPSHAEDERIPEPGLESNAADESQVSQWCVVKYDGLPYPGIIQNMDVSGYAPHRNKEILLAPVGRCLVVYSRQCTLDIAVGSRHFQLSQAEWEFVARSLNL